MITGTLTNFVDYFRTWADQDADVRFFLFGGVEKGVEVARSHPDFDYPMCWLEEPMITTLDNGAGDYSELYQVGITVLGEAPDDDYEKQLQVQQLALTILYRLQKQLRLDNRNGKLICELSGMKKEPISQLWLDNHRGWRLELQCTFNLNAFL